MKAFALITACAIALVVALMPEPQVYEYHDTNLDIILSCVDESYPDASTDSELEDAYVACGGDSMDGYEYDVR